MNATIDYEARSRCSLKDCGAFRYGVDPSTEVLMASVSADDSDEVFLWINPAFRTIDNLFQNAEVEALLAKADLVYAHNAPFEIAITWGAYENRQPSPFVYPPPLDRWRCTMAMARKAALPESLDKLTEALGAEQKKDLVGKKLIKFFCEPRADGTFNEPQDHLEKWMQFCGYCVQDNRAEKAAHHQLRAFELTGGALDTFLFDLRMNLEGIPVNVPALKHANRIIEEVQADVREKFVKLTGLTPTQREKVRELVGLPDMQAETVESAIQAGGPNSEALKLYQQVSYAAVAKIPKMLDWVCPDGRMRGVMKYHGALTGRWTAGGPQIQNAKRATEGMRQITPLAYAAVQRGCSVFELDQCYGDPLEVLASSIRHFVHAPGREMLDGDYNAIEGRIACWVAHQDDILEDWRQDKDLYKRAAAFVFQIPEESIGKGPTRDFGKVVELACQFGLGTDGFMRTCENFGIVCDDDLAERAVHGYYRPTHPKVVDYWWYLDSQMKAAVLKPGTQCGPFIVKRVAGLVYLFFRLPSGRVLAYVDPKIERVWEPPYVPKDDSPAEQRKKREGQWRQELTYWGQTEHVQWGRIRLWGSKAFENLVQAIAADIMAHGAITAETRGMRPFALIHDQGLAIRRDGHTPEEFAAALAELPAWAEGLPLKVEAKLVNYYAK